MMTILKPFLIAAALTFAGVSVTLSAHAQVWQVTNRWSPSFEVKFGNFIRNLDLNLLATNTGPWAKIPTDCADAAYTLRIIFAFENKLPVSFRSWKGRLSQDMQDLNDIQDPIKRVRKFIARVNSFTNTRTLVTDTYPLAINRESIRPGVMFLHPQGDASVPLTYRAGHVYYLQFVGENGIIRYVSSTVPADIRPLDPRNGIIFSPMETDGGYRAWVWPDDASRIGYSNEQFEIGDWRAKSYRDSRAWYEWQREIAARVRTREPTPEEQIRAQLENLTVVIENRAKAVRAGWNFYQKNYQPGQCMSEKDYENYSTPTRDVKVQLELQHFEVAAQRYVDSMGNAWGRDQRSRLNQFFRKVSFEVLPGVKVDINNLNQAFLTETTLIISEPEHSPEVRWGLKEQGRWPCPHRAKAYVGGERIQQQ